MSIAVKLSPDCKLLSETRPLTLLTLFCVLGSQPNVSNNKWTSWNVRRRVAIRVAIWGGSHCRWTISRGLLMTLYTYKKYKTLCHNVCVYACVIRLHLRLFSSFFVYYHSSSHYVYSAQFSSETRNCRHERQLETNSTGLAARLAQLAFETSLLNRL